MYIVDKNDSSYVFSIGLLNQNHDQFSIFSIFINKSHQQHLHWQQHRPINIEWQIDFQFPWERFLFPEIRMIHSIYWYHVKWIKDI